WSGRRVAKLSLTNLSVKWETVGGVRPSSLVIWDGRDFPFVLNSPSVNTCDTLSFSLNILFHLIIKLFVKVSILCKISKIVCSCIQYPFLYRFIPLYQLIWQMGKKDVVSIRTLHLKNYLNLRESRLCPKLCVNMSLRKCTSLFSRRC